MHDDSRRVAALCFAATETYHVEAQLIPIECWTKLVDDENVEADPGRTWPNYRITPKGRSLLRSILTA